MNNKIIKEVDEIIDYIKKSDTYKDYIFLEDKLSKHDKANSLINSLLNFSRSIITSRLFHYH